MLKIWCALCRSMPISWVWAVSCEMPMLLVSGVIPFRPRRARGKVRSGKLAISHAVSAWGPNLDKSWIFFNFCCGHGCLSRSLTEQGLLPCLGFLSGGFPASWLGRSWSQPEKNLGPHKERRSLDWEGDSLASCGYHGNVSSRPQSISRALCGANCFLVALNVFLRNDVSKVLQDASFIQLSELWGQWCPTF